MKSKIIFSHNHGKKKNSTKGIVFYTDHQINLKLSHRVQRILKEISKAKNILEFKPSISLKDGIEDTVNWYLNKGK